MRMAVSLSLLVAMAAPAYAGWQWTEWGMSKDEVLAAAPRAIEEQASEGKSWVLATSHEAVGFTFAAELWGYAAPDGLMAVKLTSAQSDACDAVTAGLREAYGTDALSGASALGSYWSLPDNTVVQVIVDGGRCLVNYGGLARPRVDGL